MDPFELTKRLIAIPSVTGDEAEIGLFLSDYLAELGYQVELQEVDGDRRNVIASSGLSPTFVLSTHMDTVPPYLAPTESDEFIFGRGACDAKGIMAAQIHAAEKLREQGINIGLLFTVDEELASRGAKVANEHKLAPNCSYLINGEPTDNCLAIGTKGSMGVRLTTHGKAAHSAYPEYGESAIEKLLDVLTRIQACRWPADPTFGETTCNIGVISGGTRPNVIPDEAHALLQVRVSTNQQQIKTMLEQATAAVAEVEYLSAHDPVRLLALDGFEHCVVRFTTDIPYLSNWGKALLLGPGSIFVAHTDNECIAKSEIQRAINLYVELVKRLASENARTTVVGH